MQAERYNNTRPYPEDVWASVQRAVNASPNGVPGPETATRVRAYQRARGLSPDGKVGDKTLIAMGVDTNRVYGLASIQARCPGVIMGVDVSKWQYLDSRDPCATDLNWDSMRDAGVSFVFVKTSQHERWGDAGSALSLEGAADAGLPRGAYHVAHMQETEREGGRRLDPIREADNALKRIRGAQLELPIALDLEQKLTRRFVDAHGAHAASDWIEAALERMKAGHETIIYLSRHSASLIEPRQSIIDSACWWVDTLGPWRAQARTPEGWTFQGIRQITDKAIVPGMPKPCDLDWLQPTHESISESIGGLT